MKYTATVAILDGQPDLSGEILSTNVKMPESDIPVYLNFEKSGLVGTAKTSLENDKILAEIEIFDDKLTPEMAETLSGVIGGVIYKRDGVSIEQWKLTDIGLTDKPCDPRLPKLKRKNND